MESPRRDGQNKLAKTIKEQNLKFSVEFENGEEVGHKDNVSKASVENSALFVNSTNNEEANATVSTNEHVTKTTTKARENELSRDEHVKKTKTKARENELSRDEHVTKTKTRGKEITTNEYVKRTDVQRKKEHQHSEEVSIDKTANKRRLEDSPRGNKDTKLPPIDDSKASPRESNLFGNRRSEKQKWEKPGDSGEIPIQARIRGPGPAHYLLPTTVGRNHADVTKCHSPAFSFGSRSWSFKNDSPGPAYNFDPLLGPRGKENRPSFSFGVRPKTPVRKNITPGPGAYNTDRPPLWERKAPQYSLSPRTKMRSVDKVPSPNIYQLPSTIGPNVPHQKGAPAVTIYGRQDKHGFAEDLAKTPGPARYGAFSPSLTKRRNPEFSVTGRNHAYSNKNITPGPGAYNPQNVNSHLEQSPRHVIGVKHSEFIMPTLTPADVCD